MERRRFLGSAALAVAPAMFPAVIRAQEIAALKVGTMPSMTLTPFYIADRLGYFREQGLTVQFIDFGSAANMIAPLGTGQIDVGGGGLSAGIYNAASRNIPAKIVAGLGDDPPGYGFQKIIVRTELVKSGKYKNPASLRGMTCSCGPGAGTPAAVTLNKFLNTAGLGFADVKIAQIPNPAAPAALRNGSLDAVVLPEPNATIAIEKGDGVSVASSDQFYPNDQVAVVYYGMNFLKQSHDLGVKYMIAYLKAARFYNGALAHGKIAGKNANTVIKILTDETPIKNPAIYRACSPNGTDPNGQLNLTTMREDLEFFKSAHLALPQARLEDAIDTSFVSEALKTVGPYKSA